VCVCVCVHSSSAVVGCVPAVELADSPEMKSSTVNARTHTKTFP
jgi:hypothetical protein